MCPRPEGPRRETSPPLAGKLPPEGRDLGITRQALPASDADVMEGPEPVEIPIEDSLDLHPFAPRDIPSVVGEYLEQAAARGFREVRLIHGRGTGTQRAVVRRLLRDHPLVGSFGDAPAQRGGWGATVVVLQDPAGGGRPEVGLPSPGQKVQRQE